VVDPHTHPSFIAEDVVHAVGDRLAKVAVDEIVDTHLFRLTCGQPLATTVLEVTDKLLLLRVDGDDRLVASLKLLDLSIDELELLVTVGVLGTFARLSIALQAVAQAAEQATH
jgi:hypothetical protein